MSFFSKIAELINGTPSNTTNIGGDVNSGKVITTSHREEATIPEKGHSSQKSKTIEGQKDLGTSFDKRILSSESLSEQRYGWHLYLLEILSSLSGNKPENLKYLSIYIKKGSRNHRWNDEAFKVELRQALDRKNRAHIGSSSIVIEVVSERSFKQLSEKVITEAQCKHQIDDIILFGSRKETTEQKFATAIDKRAFVINELLKKFRNSTGTDTKLMENLAIIVIRNEEDDDMAKYDWIGKRFEDDLRRELTNAFLDKIGSKSIQVVLKPKSETEGCLSLIDNQVYYKWGKTDQADEDSPQETPYVRVLATISIIDGTGSMVKPTYTLDSDIKKVYHIGRGVTSRKDGKYRINDIVIKDKEADEELLQCNAHVSSTHADIVFKNNKFYIKAAIGGCRAIGGSPTKLVRDEKATELRDTNLLYPLEDGDIIELGKNVLLVYSFTDDSSLPLNLGKERSNNAMSIDDSF